MHKVNSLFFIIYFFGFFGTINNLALGLAVLIMNVETITIFLYSLQRSIHITIYESMGNIIFQTSLLLLGYLALRQFPQVTVALSCLLVAAFVNFSFAAWQTKKSSFNFVVKFIDYIFLKDFFILSWPFALMAIANRIYGYQDVFLLRALAGEQAVGFYSLPYKITFVFQFIPLALIAALYPAFSYWWQQNHEQLMNLFERSVTILLLIVCPIVISIYYYSTDIMLLIYGWPYYPAANILQLLILSLPFIFINFPVGYLLNAANRQKVNLLNISLTLLLGIIGNLLLIPYYGFIGAAMVSLFCAMVLSILNIIQLRTIISWSRDWLQLILKILTIVIIHVMLLKILAFLPFVLSAIIGIIVYIILIFIFRLINRNDVLALIKVLKINQ